MFGVLFLLKFALYCEFLDFSDGRLATLGLFLDVVDLDSIVGGSSFALDSSASDASSLKFGIIFTFFSFIGVSNSSMLGSCKRKLLAKPTPVGSRNNIPCILI